MEKTSTVLAFLTALSGTALAGGHIAPQPMEQWGGFKGGVQLGYAFAKNKSDLIRTNNTTGDIYPIFKVRENDDGVIGGAHLGWDYQHNRFLFGLDAAFDFSGVEGSSRFQQTTTSFWQMNNKMKYAVGVIARAGIIVNDDHLFYAGIGWAGSKWNFNTSFNDTADIPDTNNSDKFLNGLRLVLGVTQKYNRFLFSLEGECTFYQSTSKSFTYTDPAAGYTYSVERKIHPTVMGLKLKLGYLI